MRLQGTALVPPTGLHVCKSFSVNKFQTSVKSLIHKIDLQDFKFNAGDVVTRLDRKRDEAGQWRVLHVLDEMIQMECLEPDRANKGVTKDPSW